MPGFILMLIVTALVSDNSANPTAITLRDAHSQFDGREVEAHVARIAPTYKQIIWKPESPQLTV